MSNIIFVILKSFKLTHYNTDCALNTCAVCTRVTRTVVLEETWTVTSAETEVTAHRSSSTNSPPVENEAK